MEDYDNDSAGTGTQDAAKHRGSDASSSNGDSGSDSSGSDMGMTDTGNPEGSEGPTVVFSKSAFEVLLAGQVFFDLEPP